MLDEPPTKRSELFRERLVTGYLASLQISSLPNSVQKTANAPSDGQSLASPRSSHDTTLTALAQLGALRLDTARALVSLIDSKRQYILAEATRTLSLQSDSRHGAADALWFGATVIPRSHGICEVVLKGASDFSETADRSGSGIITITGLDENPDFKDRAYVKSGPKLKFYAGAPIVDLGGEVIGIYCIFDDKPRSPLSHIEKQFLKDMAKSVKDHLDGLQAQAKFKRRAKLVSGLESFVGGLSALPLLSYSTEAREEIEERQWANETQEKKDGREEVGGEGEREGGKRDSISVLGRGEEPRHDRGLPKAPTTGPISTDNASIVEPLPEETPASLVDASTRLDEALSKGSRPMFARAANIIRQCGDYDCVAFFYMTASITSNGFHHSPDVLSASDSRNSGSLDALNLDSPEEHAPDLDYFREGRSQHARPPGHEPTVEGPCEVLGSSFKDIKCKADIDSLGHFPRFSRRDLQSVLGKHPRAKTISFFPSGDVIGDTSSSGSGMEQPGPLEDLGQDIDASHKTQPQHTKPKKSRLLSLRKLSPDAQSFVILPLWDFERHRWFTCCICWSAAARTGVDLEGDLQYLRVFGNSIMMALCHLDAAFTNRAKQSFVASISHELRSPLHGILGALELLYDTDLSRFQHEMVDSISSCGRTLLDTLEHVMDIARINSFSRQKRETNLANGRSGEDKSTQTHVVQARASIFDLSGLIEEVVEAVWIGHVGQGLPHQFEDLSSFTDGSDHPGHISTTSTFSRGRIRIALQLPYRQDWLVNMQAGALRRIVMNIFGNALKYTTEGLITLVLRVDAVQMHELQFSVLVEDTGCGISDDYQRNFLFKPFFQESNLSPGSGLGLSIVKQITDDLRGHIRLSSSKGKGTQVQVTLTTPAISNKKVITSVPQKPMSEETIRQGLAGLRIRILTSATASDVSQRGEIATNAECQQARSLEQLGADWYGVDIAVLPSWYPGAADIVVLLEPDFRSLKQIEAESAGSKRHSVLLVASDSVEMSALRSDDRISGTRLVIEVLAQPVGPRKLGQALEKILERLRANQSKATLKHQHDSKNETTPFRRTSTAATTQPPPSQPPLSPTLPVRSASLPRIQPPAPTSPMNSSTLTATTKPKALLVDDNPINLRLLTTFIEKLGVPTLQATNGREAVEAYTTRTHRGAFAVIFMDISMPVMNGIVATQLIRQCEVHANLPRVPVVALTGLASGAARNEAREAGMNDYLTKPLNFAKLKSVLRRYRDREEGFRAEGAGSGLMENLGG